jgi:hypothetical protein
MFNLRDQIKNQIAGKLLKFIGFSQAGFLLAVLASPFIWVWHSWEMAWKTGLTGLIGVFAMLVTYKLVNIVVDQGIDEYLNPKK